MNKVTKLVSILVLLLTFSSADARFDPEVFNKMKDNVMMSGNRADCQPGQRQVDMEINNVRARLLTGGDLWWDLENGRYIVPKPADGFKEVSAIFAGGVWIGGIDPNRNLKLAGVLYRNGNSTDFYPGPLDDNGETEQEICADWDRFFTVFGDEIRKEVARFDNGEGDISCDSIPANIKYWPGKGNPYFNESYDFPLPDQDLGSFWDEDGDGIYNPCMGDFPIIEIRGCFPANRAEAVELLPDQMIFWIYNDNGGPHRLSQATAIRMEVQVQSFAYATNDEINDMSFYRFKLINRASQDIRDCYFAMWVDPDLGCHQDDYIGCDVDRSLAIIYNEDALDGNPGTACPGGINTYEDNVPLLGIDYFRGPRGPKVFCRDADGNILTDENGEVLLCEPEPETGAQDTLVELGMTSFVYQNNAGVGNPDPATTDPQIGDEYYNILRGLWRDGTPITYGGSGFNPDNEEADTVRYVFPDPPNTEGWSMCTEDLPFGDRRTVQATGPLLLQPNETNELIIGAVFVPNVVYDCPDISRLQTADDLAQALFNSCFNIVDGPDAPDMAAVELDRQLILILSNDTVLVESNNAKEQYEEVDIISAEFDNVPDSLYRFEGYKLYQLANPNVSVQELDNIELARLIRQVDIKNGIEEIYNWNKIPNPDPNAQAPLDFLYVPERQVAGADAGIRHSFNILNDQFAETDKRLINHKNYYFTVVAYGYNNWETFDPYSVEEVKGQDKSYLEGRRNVRTYTFTPRPIIYQELQSAYGQEATVTRLEGKGTGLNALDLAEGERESMIDGSFDGEITYKPGNGPINPVIIDPLNIKDGTYELSITGDYNESNPTNPYLEEGARWTLRNLNTGEVISSEKTLEDLNEQIVYGQGFSISVNQVNKPGDGSEDNGYIGQEVEYEDGNAENWWNVIPAFTGFEIVIDEEEDQSVFVYEYADTENESDPDNVFTSTSGTQFIPMYEARWREEANPYLSPGWIQSQGFPINQNKLQLEDLNNVDIVFTSDKSKWSKCVVVEAAAPFYAAGGILPVGNATQFSLRESPSIDENGNEIPDDMGMSYFPGYAVDVETGERLNIFFAENSAFNTSNDEILTGATGVEVNTGNIGADMIWNPTTELFTPGLTGSVYGDLAGGQHYVYVTRQPYDECEYLKTQFAGGLFNKINGVSLITWTTFPLPSEPLLSLEEGLIPNDVVVKCRVTSPYGKVTTPQGGTDPVRFDVSGELPKYQFSFTDVEAREIEPVEYSEAMENVQVVPNPYYAYSSYESDQFDNTVKITNLPLKAVVTIYSLDGKFIQQFNRDASPVNLGGNNPAIPQMQPTASIEWNLNNSKGIPVASGVYIFHILDPVSGTEKSIKWFGVNRRFDPTGL